MCVLLQTDREDYITVKSIIELREFQNGYKTSKRFSMYSLYFVNVYYSLAFCHLDIGLLGLLAKVVVDFQIFQNNFSCILIDLKHMFSVDFAKVMLIV